MTTACVAAVIATTRLSSHSLALHAIWTLWAMFASPLHTFTCLGMLLLWPMLTEVDPHIGRTHAASQLS